MVRRCTDAHQFDVLEALSARPALVFSRLQVIDAVWDQSWVGDETSG